MAAPFTAQATASNVAFSVSMQSAGVKAFPSSSWKGARNEVNFSARSLLGLLSSSTGGKTRPVAAPSVLLVRAAAGAYICQDCGYIYTGAFDRLSSDYQCPVCSAPKRRFKPYKEPVERNVNATAVRKARKEQLKKADAAVGSALPIILAAIFAVLLGTAAFLNSLY
eukprot:TRINITY_DN7112_c0_g1_i1.p1 TRINITY_DN7112_c0_g1~~TRINITY_DN7112_c0_g1_i1.p1  ORF type:complete len:167 (+),score=34.99 TRINITY_DN7112_c0_g1_i1:50-550(+)